MKNSRDVVSKIYISRLDNISNVKKLKSLSQVSIQYLLVMEQQGTEFLTLLKQC